MINDLFERECMFNTAILMSTQHQRNLHDPCARVVEGLAAMQYHLPDHGGPEHQYRGAGVSTGSTPVIEPQMVESWAVGLRSSQWNGGGRGDDGPMWQQGAAALLPMRKDLCGPWAECPSGGGLRAPRWSKVDSAAASGGELRLGS